jgi:hypothetical protein
MQTVNVVCKNCGRVIAVEEQLFGQQVPCPTCQQPVETPARTLAEPSAPVDELSPTLASPTPESEEHESIFHIPEHAADALFGAADIPKIEIPPPIVEPPAPSQQPSEENLFSSLPGTEDTLFTGSDVPKDQVPFGEPAAPGLEASTTAAPVLSAEVASPPSEPAMTWTMEEPSAPPTDGTVETAAAAPAPVPSEVGEPAGGPLADAPVLPSSGVGLAVGPPSDPAAFTASSTDLASLATDLAPGPGESFPIGVPRRVRYSSMRGGLLIPLMVSLFSWSVAATVAVVILYFRPPQPSLEYLPDVEGDFRGAKHEKQGPLSYERLDPDTKLPDRLKIHLGQSIQLGDLKVSAQKVELSRITIQRPDLGLEPAADDSLVLHLIVQNVSEDVVFCPTDPYFDRQWKSSQESKPYTFLQVGNQRFYGGPLPWRPGRRSEAIKTVVGQAYKTLRPGEQLATVACTDPVDHVGRSLATYRGRLLYRVQVRRGLVRVGEREVSATAVVGVEFDEAEIEKPAL